MADDRKTKEDDYKPRWDLARWVAIFSLGAVALLGLSALALVAFATDKDATLKDRFIYVKDLLTMLLPVIGAWMGTVLAYFFSKENFRAATEGQARLIEATAEDRLVKFRVKDQDVMIARADMLVYQMGTKTPDAVKLQADCRALLTANNRNRLPVLGAQGEPLYIIHRSVMDDYTVAAINVGGGGKTPADQTLADLLADSRIGPIVKTIVTVDENATLADVRARMDAQPQCLDVFVTSDGTPRGKVIGWVTNQILTQKGRLS